MSFQNSDISRYYPEAVRRFTHVLVPVASVLAMGQFVLRGSISIGHDRFCLKLVDGEQAQFEDLFSAFDIFGNAFVLNLLITLKVFAWSLLFVIPGIVKAYAYSMAYYIKLDHPDYGWNVCITASRQLMDGHKWEKFVLDLSFLGWIIVGSLCLGVGTLWVTPYMEAANAQFYEYVRTCPSVAEG